MQFNAQQFLYGTFLDIMHIFGSVKPLCESVFPFLYIIIFQIWQSLEPLAPLPGGDRHVRPLTFLFAI